MTVYRVCLIGPSKSGKSTWLNRWITDRYDVVPSTTDLDIRTITIPTSKGRLYIIVYDVSDRFSYIHCGNIDLCICMYDTSDKDSLYYSLICRDEFTRRYPHIPTILIGNKIDMGISGANITYICSSKTGEYIHDTQLAVLRLLTNDDSLTTKRHCWIM